MRQIQETLRQENTTSDSILYIAFELSNTTWKLAFGDGSKVCYATVDARKLVELEEEINKAKKRFKLRGDVQIKSCYEAGRDGFWIHRYLLSKGINNLIVDSSSIEVNRRKRRAKSDRLDAGNLLRLLLRYHGGEKQVWKVLNVPSVEDEDARNLHRELETLHRERRRYRNRIKALLIQQGIEILILPQKSGVGVKPFYYYPTIPVHNVRVTYNHSLNAFSGDCSRLRCS